MNSTLAARPHTVGAMSSSSLHTDYIMKILDEIENEATSSQHKSKVPEKNYLKENCKRLRDIQAKAKQKSAEKLPLQPIRALNKYSNVQPKISTVFNAHCTKDKFDIRQRGDVGLPRTAGPYRTQAPLSPCLSAKSDNHRSLHHYKSLPQLNPTRESNKVSEHSSNARRREEEDFLYHKSSQDHSSLRNKEKCDTKSEAKHRPGQIPSYLTERKKQWELERERQLKLIEEASIPAGHTLLPDEERLETLELLKKNHEELLQSLASLPVRNDTLRLQHYKDDLEHQLAKVEEGIKIFSKPKVLIKNET